MLTSRSSNAKPHFTIGSPFPTGTCLLRASLWECHAWAGLGRVSVTTDAPIAQLPAQMRWPESQCLNPEYQEPGCSPRCSSLGIPLAGALAAFPCALVHQGMRGRDKGLVGSQWPGRRLACPLAIARCSCIRCGHICSAGSAARQPLMKVGSFVPAFPLCPLVGVPGIRATSPAAALYPQLKGAAPWLSSPGSRSRGFVAFPQLP